MELYLYSSIRLCGLRLTTIDKFVSAFHFAALDGDTNRVLLARQQQFRGLGFIPQKRGDGSIIQTPHALHTDTSHNVKSFHTDLCFHTQFVIGKCLMWMSNVVFSILISTEGFSIYTENKHILKC